jgi:DNA-binding HxlR family transcriptional regulator
MKNLHITNTNFITFKDDLLTIDVLGGVDLVQVERMICTLRISHANFPPFRTTLDLYNDSQNDKLIRTLCDKYELQLLEVSKVLNLLTSQLEEYRLDNLKYTGTSKKIAFELSEEDKSNAVKKLRNKNLLNEVIKSLNTTGIIGENENALILFLALASHKYSNPFSVLCLAKSGIGKSYIIQKLSECMPINSFSFHTQISENALYYFDSKELQNKALLIEDLEWTHNMLSPLATLQSQGKLIKTRTIKDKDGMFHSTTFEVVGNLCLVACAYSDKNYEELSLPFLCIQLNHSQNQDIEIMDYQKKCKAGLIQETDIRKTQHVLKSLIATLEDVKIINPYAPLINLPNEIAYPRKSLLLLLNFIDIITYFHQYQREKTADKKTGEVQIMTAIEDIELAFKLLKNNLFRRADELSTSARGFYHWLSTYLTEAKTNQFTALDIRKIKRLHPRTLNRYLQELKLFNYIQVVGGNKHREGFIYKLTSLGDQSDTQARIENDLKETLEKIKASKSVGQTPMTNTETQA